MNTPIRVVHLITKLELGGAQRNTLYSARHLQEYGHEVHLWYGPGGVLTPEAETLANHWCVQSLERSINPLSDLKSVFHLVRQLKSISPHILHTHSSKAGFLGRKAAMLAKIPLRVHSVHGFPFSPQQPRWKQRLFRSMEIMAARWTSHFVFVSRSDRETALKMGLCRTNHSLIHSGFPLGDYLPKHENRARQRARFHIPDDAAVIGVVAPFKPQKGLLHLVDVARQVASQTPVVFIVAGDGALRPKLEKAIEQKGLTSCFRLPGFLFDLPDIMDMFDLGVSTALWEGLPQSLVQMRLKHIPLVVSRISGNDEVVRQGENGFLVSPGDTAGFSRCILRLLHDRDLQKKLGDAPENFSSWDASFMVAEQDRLYRQLVARRFKTHAQETAVSDVE